MTLDRTTPPVLKEIGSMHIPEPTKYTLDNGIEVYAINAGFQELVKVEFLFRNDSYDPAQPLVNYATHRMMSEGTKNHTALQLADAIDYYGAFYETEENADFNSANLFTLNKYLGETLPHVKEILTEAVFPEKEFSVYRQNNRQRLQVENEKVGSLSRRKFAEVLYGSKHQYGHFTTPEDYDALQRDWLIEHYRRKYTASRCLIIVSGMVDDKIISLLNRSFGDASWNRNESPVADLAQMSMDPEKKHLLEKNDAVQSAIRIGKRMFNRTHPDYPAFSVMNTVLGGYFGSRLMSNIREDKGYTYGIGSAIVSMKQDGYFFISTEVGADVTSKALIEIYKEVDSMKTELTDPEELEMVRNYMLGSFLKGIDGAFHLAERFKSVHLYGLGYDYYQRYLQKLKTIDAEEIRQMAVKYLDSSTFYEVVAGRK
jgi:zinc protease